MFLMLSICGPGIMSNAGHQKMQHKLELADLFTTGVEAVESQMYSKQSTKQSIKL